MTKGIKTSTEIAEEVVRLASAGMTRSQIATELSIGLTTVSRLLKRCRQKLNKGPHPARNKGRVAGPLLRDDHGTEMAVQHKPLFNFETKSVPEVEELQRRAMDIGVELERREAESATMSAEPERLSQSDEDDLGKPERPLGNIDVSKAELRRAYQDIEVLRDQVQKLKAVVAILVS